MAGRRMNYGPRFSGPGGRQSQSIAQVSGLLRKARCRAQHYEKLRETLLEKARAGDVIALYKLKKLNLACHQGRVASLRAKRRPPTKVKFSWDKE